MVDVACAFLKGRQHLVQTFWGPLPAISSIYQPPTLSVWCPSAKGNRVTILSTARRKLLCYSPTGLPGEGPAPCSETQKPNFPIPLVLCEEKQDRPHFQKPHFSSASTASSWSCWVLLSQAPWEHQHQWKQHQAGGGQQQLWVEPSDKLGHCGWLCSPQSLQHVCSEVLGVLWGSWIPDFMYFVMAHSG